MKKKLLFLTLALSSLCAAQVKPEWAVFSLPLKWESSPPGLEIEIKTAAAHIRVCLIPSDELRCEGAPGSRRSLALTWAACTFLRFTALRLHVLRPYIST